MTIIIASISVFLILLVLGLPIAFSLGSGALVGMTLMGTPLKVIAQKMFTGMDSFSYMAIAFFIMAGELMNKCGITDGLVEFSRVIVGRIRGGLAHVNVLASVFFAGITGVAVADTSALGSILIPAMEKAGYDTEFSTAITAASSIIGPIIPPSVIMVVYALVSGVSVGGLFMAGFVPGLLIALGLMILSYYYAVKRDYPCETEPFSFSRLWSSFRQAIIALLMPLIILGGILSGVFTPTEAASVAVAYALIVGFFIRKTLTVEDLPEIMLSGATMTAIILFIVGAVNGFVHVMAMQQVPQMVVSALRRISDNPSVILLVMNLLFLFVGCFMEPAGAILIFVPILSPVMTSLGIHPLHFGIITVVNLTIGLITPPVGAVLYVASAIGKISVERLIRAIAPMVAIEVGVLLLITYIPALTLTLPRLFGFVY